MIKKFKKLISRYNQENELELAKSKFIKQKQNKSYTMGLFGTSEKKVTVKEFERRMSSQDEEQNAREYFELCISFLKNYFEIHF